MTQLADLSAPPLRNASGGQSAATALSILVFSALSLAAGATSQGFLEADGCTHYLYARFALDQPHFLVNVWGRPLFTTLYALPAKFGGLLGARTLSLVLAILCAIVTMLIARGQKLRWPVLALIFTLAQPLVFLHSFSELTELPFATLIGFAFLAYQRRSWLAMSILAAFGPLARPEGFGFLCLAGAALIAHRRWWWLLVLPLLLILWNHAGWVVYGRQEPWWQWLPRNWPYSTDSLYERGSIFYFAALLPAVTSPLLFPATCIGIWQGLLAKLNRQDHLARCRALIAIVPLLILAGHSVLYASGKLASSGEPRYMLIVAPFWGVLSAIGWEWMFERFRWTHPLRWAGAAALGVVIANAAYPVVPLRGTEDLTRSRHFVEWYRHSGAEQSYRRVCTAQMNVYFLLDLSPLDPHRAMEFRVENLSQPRDDTIVLWDPIYSLYNSDARRSIPLEQLLENGWTIDASGTAAVEGGWNVLRSAVPRPDAAMPETRRSRPSP